MTNLPDVEASVLGAILLEQDALSKVAHLLKPEDFTINANKHIYASLISLYNNNKDIDMHTILVELRKKGLEEKTGGVPYLAQLTHNIASSAHVETHARLLVECTMRREAIKACEDLLKEARKEEGDVFDLLDHTDKSIQNIVSRVFRSGEPSKMNNEFDAFISELEHFKKHPDGLIGAPSGFTIVDRYLRGWERGSLIVIGARPAMGKTSLLLQLFRQANVPALFCSLEMSKSAVRDRLIAQETGISLQKIRERSLTEAQWKQLYDDTANLYKAPIYIDATGGLSLFELKAKARKLKHKEDIQLIVIDYLQLMTVDVPKGSTREREISSISRGLKELALELDVAIIVASQLNRSLEARADKRPLLSDLRESGAIEQDADIVMFLHRPEYYEITEDEDGATAGRAEILIAKNRNGVTGRTDLLWRPELTKFSNPGAF